MFFRDEYRFLSNFSPSPMIVGIHGELQRVFTVEHAYQALRCVHAGEALKVLACKTPGRAKRMGQKISMRGDWDEIKYHQMSKLLNKKFHKQEQFTAHLTANEDYLPHNLLQKLLSVEGEIIEHNSWHDNYWGSCVCTRCGDNGKNDLGEILMSIREANKES